MRPRDPAKHILLRQKLQHDITARLRPHDMLPTERELAAQFGVSRMTIRQALRALRDDGLIHSVRGVGTFVAQPRVSKTPALTSFSEDMRARGYRPGSRLVRAEEVEAEVGLAVDLGVDPGSVLYRIERVRLADGIPMCHEETFLPRRLFPGLLDLDLKGSLYELLELRYRVSIIRAELRTRAITLGRRQAELLTVPARSPALHVRRITIDAKGRTIERGESVYRGDRYDFSTTVTRHGIA